MPCISVSGWGGIVFGYACLLCHELHRLSDLLVFTLLAPSLPTHAQATCPPDQDAGALQFLGGFFHNPLMPTSQPAGLTKLLLAAFSS